jgi:hypothetical protein
MLEVPSTCNDKKSSPPESLTYVTHTQTIKDRSLSEDDEMGRHASRTHPDLRSPKAGQAPVDELQHILPPVVAPRLVGRHDPSGSFGIWANHQVKIAER